MRRRRKGFDELVHRAEVVPAEDRAVQLALLTEEVRRVVDARVVHHRPAAACGVFDLVLVVGATAVAGCASEEGRDHLGGGAAGYAEELELQPEGLPGKVGGGCGVAVVDCYGVLLSARRLFPPGVCPAA